MQNPALLRREAEEAQHLAKIVSYAEDKKRLTLLAERLLRQADALESAKQAPDGEPSRPGVRSWLNAAIARR